GQIDTGTLDHPAMFTSLAVLGSVVIDVDGARLDATFVDDQSRVRDSFTIIKGPIAPPTETACSNGADDDADGEADCADADCAGADTDGDLRLDCRDDCA